MAAPQLKPSAPLAWEADRHENHMTIASFERLGAACFMVGSTLLAAYAVLFAVLIPVGGAGADYSRVVLDSNWVRLSLVAFIAILFMLAGLDAVFSESVRPPVSRERLDFCSRKSRSSFRRACSRGSFSSIPSSRQIQGLLFFSASALSRTIRGW